MQDLQTPEPTTQNRPMRGTAKQGGRKFREPYLTTGKNNPPPPKNNKAGPSTQATHSQNTNEKRVMQSESAETTGQEHQTPDHPTVELTENAMREIQFHDPDEQR